MSANSKIEWTDHTFNPWEGCQKVGSGCDHCYAETRNARFGGGVAVNWGPGAPRRRTSTANWQKPLAWNAAHEKFFTEHGRRQRVFCASLADVFDNAVPRQWRQDLFDLILATPDLDWLLLTKRIGNAGAMLQDVAEQRGALMDAGDRYRPMPNVWIGATIVNQEEADRDVPKLLAVPAARRFLSMEPLLGPVDLRNVAVPKEHDQLRRPWEYEGYKFNALQEHDDNRFHQAPATIDWVIAGGESGPGARPIHPDWARDLRDQCAAAGVPFLFKQWGEWLPAVEGRSVLGKTLILEGAAPFTDKPQWHGFEGGQKVARVGKKAAGRQLDGVQHDGFPEVA